MSRKTRQQEIDISKIIVEERIRIDLGSLPEGRESFESFKKSISEHGLIEPVVLRETPTGFFLVAGGRRLKACVELGWTSIPCHIFPASTTVLESRIVELLENYDRKDLTWSEEVRGRALIDSLMKEEHGELPHGVNIKKPDGSVDPRWSTAKTAELTGVSQRVVNTDIELAKAIEVFPTELGGAKTKKQALGRLNRIKAETGISLDTSGDPEKSERFKDLVKEKLYLIRSSEEFGEKIRSFSPNLLILTRRLSDADLTKILEIVDPKCWIVCTKPVPTWSPLIWTWPQSSWTEPRFLQPNFQIWSYKAKGEVMLNKVGRGAVFSFKRVPPSLRVQPDEKPIELWQEVIDTFCNKYVRILVPFCDEGNMILAALNLGINKVFGFNGTPELRETFVKKVNLFTPGQYTSFPGSLTGKKGTDEDEEL